MKIILILLFAVVFMACGNVTYSGVVSDKVHPRNSYYRIYVRSDTNGSEFWYNVEEKQYEMVDIGDHVTVTQDSLQHLIELRKQ